jgi:hypothetical protein
MNPLEGPFCLVGDSGQAGLRRHCARNKFLRAKANNFELYTISLIHILNKVWDTAKHEKETAPIVATIDEKEGSNQIKGKIYAY